MIIFVTGGSGSGKSAYAEERAMSLSPVGRVYLATMENFGRQDQKRIDRHRQLRAGKGFFTVEQTRDLQRSAVPEDTRVILLECITSLAGNELYFAGNDEDSAFACFKSGINYLKGKADHLVVVSDLLSSDGIVYPEETMAYIRLMGRINAYMAHAAQEVTEVVCGIPLRVK